jgi:hypothetical protein
MREKLSNKHKGIFVFLTLISIGALCVMPSISQDPHYHHFADGRTFIGIPNFLNVVSNLPFLIVGIIGLMKLTQVTSVNSPKEAMICFFVSVILTGLGSAWYHLNPDNNSLLWDRLPMALTFMSLLSAVISLHIEQQRGKKALAPLLILGVTSVLYWYITELNGHGDLRPYIFVQFFPMLMIPVIMFTHPIDGAKKKILLPMIGMYIVAKYFEYSDHDLYAFGNIVSGHSLKHLFAAGATAAVLKMVVSNSKYQVSSTKYQATT